MGGPLDSGATAQLMPDITRAALSPDHGLHPRQSHQAAVTAVLGLALAVGLAACGGSSQKTSTVTTAAAATATTAAGSSPAGTTASPSTTAKKASGGGGGKFCDEARAAAAKSISSAGTSTDTDSLAKDYAEIKTIGPKLVASAPAAIRPQMQALIGFDLKFYGILSKADFNYAKISASDLSAIESSATSLSADATAVTSYVQNTCGVDLETSTTT
jgi:hypothetical protein